LPARFEKDLLRWLLLLSENQMLANRRPTIPKANILPHPLRLAHAITHESKRIPRHPTDTSITRLPIRIRMMRVKFRSRR
jgi:hypothetical protein